MGKKKNIKKESSENFAELEIVQDNVQQPEPESNEPKQEGSVEVEAGSEEVPASNGEVNDAPADQDEVQELKPAASPKRLRFLDIIKRTDDRNKKYQERLKNGKGEK